MLFLDICFCKGANKISRNKFNSDLSDITLKYIAVYVLILSFFINLFIHSFDFVIKSMILIVTPTSPQRNLS